VFLSNYNFNPIHNFLFDYIKIGIGTYCSIMSFKLIFKNQKLFASSSDRSILLGIYIQLGVNRSRFVIPIMPIQIKSCFSISLSPIQMKNEVSGVVDKLKRFKLHRYFSCEFLKFE